MSTTTLQYVLNNRCGTFSLTEQPYPTLKPNEIAIRTKAVALNPLDWKSRLFGVLINSWPAVLGIDFAGVIDSVGQEVTQFKPGDHVFSLGGFDNMGNRSGAFQEVVTVPWYFAGKKPLYMRFEDAASLPVCYLTAVDALCTGLKLPLPPGKPVETASFETVLILGGSSCVGAALIQLLRLAVPQATILTTSSAKHHERLISLGATKCLERSHIDNISEVKAITPSERGVDAIVDCVSAAVSQPAAFLALDNNGPKLYSEVITGDKVQVPEGINATVAFAKNALGAEGGMTLIQTLSTLLEDGLYRVPIPVQIVGEGYSKIEEGLDLLKEGVSGLKYAVIIEQ